MGNGALPHDPTSCALCERVPRDTYRRHWKEQEKARPWHVILDGPNLTSRLPRQSHFVTILSYHLAPDGSPAMYSGPFYGECDAADVEYAFADLRRCIELLHTEYDCPLEAIRVWHSGSRGPHFTIPSLVFGGQDGHSQLPQIYAAMIQQLFPPNIAPTLDRSVYSGGKGRMWGLPNRRRSDTGRYKVPLSVREVLHKPYTDIKALTLRPRKGVFWPSDEDLSPCPGLVELYQKTKAAIEQAGSAQPLRAPNISACNGDSDLLLSRCAFIRHSRDHAATLSEPEWYAMISNVARCTDGPAAVHRLSGPYPRYSPRETDAKIAHALHDTGAHRCAFIQALGF
jgi:hypothetical protein